MTYPAYLSWPFAIPWRSTTSFAEWLSGHDIFKDAPRDRLHALYEREMTLTYPPSQLSQLFEWQSGQCATCGRQESLVLDHDHKTGLVRGYLCRGCNISEGYRHGGIFDWYRKYPPTVLMGFRLRYDGWGNATELGDDK